MFEAPRSMIIRCYGRSDRHRASGNPSWHAQQQRGVHGAHGDARVLAQGGYLQWRADGLDHGCNRRGCNLLRNGRNSTPPISSSSVMYAAPNTISSTETLKAIVLAPDDVLSAVNIAAYTID